jgi:hypothetical protein
MEENHLQNSNWRGRRTSRKLSKTQNTLKPAKNWLAAPQPKATWTRHSPKANPTGALHRSDRSGLGSSGWIARRGSTPPNSLPDLPIHSTDSHKTLGILGAPHGHPIALFWSTKTHWIKRNRRISTKNTTFPKPRKTPKLSPFIHGFGRGITSKRTTKVSCKHPPPNPKEKGLKATTRKSPRKGSENHQKGKIGETQSSLEESRWIIYTYDEGSYKV